MNKLRFNLIILLCSFLLLPLFAQSDGTENKTIYNVEILGSAATGTNTPFWITNNRYGVIPLEAGNGYLRPSIRHDQSWDNGLYWTAGVDAVLSAPRYRNVYIQQLYAGIGYKNIQLTIGSKERYTSLWDKELSSGDMIQSANARPIPGIHISIPEFLTVPYTKGWFHIRGYLSVGRSFDTDYLNDFIQTDQTYTRNVLWHDKSAFFQLKDTRGDFPLYASFGLRHTAQWGGVSINPELGKQPQSLTDFIRIFFVRSGDASASTSDQINILGSHHIAYDFQLGFARKNWELQAYYQHIASDKSGVLFYNKTDGLWGLQLDLPHFPWIRKIVMEHIITTNQSGPFHYIDFDHDAHPGRGGGADNYYNNGEYTTGHSYFNRGNGNPLIAAPEYNTDGSLGFKNTRIKGWHIGLQGNLHQQITYRTLLTVVNGWGTPYQPFLKKNTGTLFLLELGYTHPRMSDWKLTGSLAGDTGNYTGDRSYGVSIGITKSGILKRWH